MTYVHPFRKLGKKDAHLAGGKGASLGEMIQHSIPVPDGFVVLAQTFNAFLAQTDLTQEIDAILHQVNPEAVHTIDRASKVLLV